MSKIGVDARLVNQAREKFLHGPSCEFVKDGTGTCGPDCIPGTVTQSKGRLLITGLAPREREVLDLIAEGLSAKEIASKLNISCKTAETHRNNIRKKVGKGYHTANLIGILRHFYNLIPKHNTDVAWLVVLRERKEYLEQELRRTCDMIRHEERRHQ